MKIAMVGCGALGTFYGAKICRAGHEVHFLLRSDFEAVQARGVEIRSVDGDFKVFPRCARFPREIGPAEVVLIGLKTTANSEFVNLLPPLVGPQTLVVTLQNGLGNEEQLAALFGPDNVLGGLCFVCLNRVAPGVVLHTAHGRIVLGEYCQPIKPRTQALAEVFRQAGLPCELTSNLERSHWEKLIWNVPFNGLGVAGSAGYQSVSHGTIASDTLLGPCLTTDILLGDPQWERLVRELMGEVIQTARALGHNLPDALADENIERTRCMGAYKASTLLDYERQQSLELESLFLKPLHYARYAEVPVPRLQNLYDVLVELDLFRKYHVAPRDLQHLK
jgi:2-dehydropantoate 2-reductase